jgi:hypothetical protein
MELCEIHVVQERLAQLLRQTRMGASIMTRCSNKLRKTIDVFEKVHPDVQALFFISSH